MGMEDTPSWMGAPSDRSFAPSTPSTVHQPLKRSRPEEDAALDDRFAERGEAFMSGPPPSSQTGNPFAVDDGSSPEMRHFAPLLIAINDARRKLCSAVELIVSRMVDIPPEQVLTVKSTEFARARMRPL